MLSPLRMSSSPSVPTETTSPSTTSPPLTAIIGAGPAGLATAIMLARLGTANIHVYERLPPPAATDDAAAWSDTAKFYLIGLGGRGQKALRELGGGAWERVERRCVTVLGRKDWAPGAGVDEGVERIFGDDRPYKTKVLARDMLAGVLREVAMDEYDDAISLHYHTEMVGVRWEEREERETAVVTVQTEDGVRTDVRCALLVGADGTARTLAAAMESHTAPNDGAPNDTPRVRVVRYDDDNRRVYKTVPMKLPDSKTWRKDVNYSARTKDGRVVLDALPATTAGDYCAVLLLKADDEYARPHTDPVGLRALLDETLPQFSPLVSDDSLASVADKPPSNIPRFRYVGPQLHTRGGSTVLLGDAIHTVKPYFGLGVNSALEDVLSLRDALERHPTDRPTALIDYSRERAGEAEALVRISRGLDRPGLLGFLTFVLPIILDGIFHGAAPHVFELNTIALLQRDGISFVEVGRLKRRDRVLQVAVIGMGVIVVSTLAGVVSSVVGSGSPLGVVPVPVLGLGVSLVLGGSQVLRVWEPGMAPADVLAKTLQPVTDVISAEDRGKVMDDDDEDDDDDDGGGGVKTRKNRLPFIGNSSERE